MPVFHDLQQGSTEWLDFRKNKISASKIGIIMGLSPWKSPYMQWAEDVGLTEPTEPTAAMKRGSLMEADALREYCQLTGLEMKSAVITHTDYPDFMASLDGITYDSKHIVEIKCPGQKGHEEAISGDVKPLYIAQMGWQMFCTGLSKCDYFSYSGEQGHIIEFLRDDDLINEMIVKANEYLEMIRILTPPPFTELDYEDMSNNPDWDNLMAYYADYDQMEKKGKEGKEHVKKLLIDIANGRNCKGSSSKFTKVSTKGRVNYDQIPELKGVDLDKYRGEPVISYRITLDKNNG